MTPSFFFIFMTVVCSKFYCHMPETCLGGSRNNIDEMSASLPGKRAVDEAKIPADLGILNSCHKHHLRSTGRS